MVIPAVAWADLEPPAKRERILDAARTLFSRDGLDAPMPALAAAIGVGVGSVYRCYPSKHDLIAALVVERLDEVSGAVLAASARDIAPGQALRDVLRELAEQQAGDDLMGVATELVAAHPEVRRARASTMAAFDALLARAKADGQVRADATSRDVHLLFVATRAARAVDREGWRRVLELFVDALTVPATPTL